MLGSILNSCVLSPQKVEARTSFHYLNKSSEEEHSESTSMQQRVVSVIPAWFF